MNQVCIIDSTLCRKSGEFSFKEKLEIARQLLKLNVSVIEFPEISDERADALLIRTINTLPGSCLISVGADGNMESVEKAGRAVSLLQNARIRIAVPVSTVNMEYTFHKKAEKVLEIIRGLALKAHEYCENVEIVLQDSTRADEEFLLKVIEVSKEAGVTSFTVSDDACIMLPDDFSGLAKRVIEKAGCPVYVSAGNLTGMAVASSVLAVKAGASGIKCGFGGDIAELPAVIQMFRLAGETYGLKSDMQLTGIESVVNKIRKITEPGASLTKAGNSVLEEYSIRLYAEDSREEVLKAVRLLGYEPDEETIGAIYEEFKRTAEKTSVGAKELDAIVTSISMQAPQTYKLVSYLINNGNIIHASAQIELSEGEELHHGISIGNGPIDAAFMAIEKIIGHHYELDDFQIRTVTEGMESLGSATVKLRSMGTVYTGTGVSTDIIGASIRAYISALNKIVYEEA